MLPLIQEFPVKPRAKVARSESVRHRKRNRMKEQFTQQKLGNKRVITPISGTLCRQNKKPEHAMPSHDPS